ncbi:keratin-associated protein 6-2-like [Juglans microcarpa x Juglans regia]|uniref:keratin-associated protein 6-2-like n=1 Tax=Juglans microcarpa x Juglans regia TaxID=2249226 RepID=UPI001B7F0F6A|nr:keratin-associated protein 6-2-like [Juglans microcarpa x Juglans regia]
MALVVRGFGTGIGFGSSSGSGFGGQGVGTAYGYGNGGGGDRGGGVGVGFGSGFGGQGVGSGYGYGGQGIGAGWGTGIGSGGGSQFGSEFGAGGGYGAGGGASFGSSIGVGFGHKLNSNMKNQGFGACPPNWGTPPDCGSFQPPASRCGGCQTPIFGPCCQPSPCQCNNPPGIGMPQGHGSYAAQEAHEPEKSKEDAEPIPPNSSPEQDNEAHH